MSHNVPVQSLIDHIKTAIDVDPWAKEMAEDLLKGQEAVVRCEDCKFGEACKNGRGEHGVMCYNSHSASHSWVHEQDWYCADGERRTEDE